ncbi:NAD(P)-binding domain-containing protein [Streptomyces sp. NBC_01433]|uniref:imine reductase family protein n=1 Tax=Streptomyces sp. NBC_01433 TaxID=2903864 RepID=UPI002B1CC710|nr:NAD(P)-binding domain-containing protein [Streptomyces sp. NBC_01433]
MRPRGYEVTVWNRTASKADGLVAGGAVLAPSAEDALTANDLVILSLTDYDAMYAILEPMTAALPGRVVANLSSDTPQGVASMEHVVDTVRAAGVGVALPEAVLDVFRRGVAAGHADSSLTSLRGVLRAVGTRM